MPSTSRSTNGFGITDKHPTTPIPTTDYPSSILSSTNHTDDEPCNKGEFNTSIINSIKSDFNVSMEIPYNISLSLNLSDNYTHRTIQVKGIHPSLSLSLQLCKSRNIPQINEYLKNTLTIRIPRWQTELKHSYIIAINNKPVKTIDDNTSTNTVYSRNRYENNRCTTRNFPQNSDATSTRNSATIPRSNKRNWPTSVGY